MLLTDLEKISKSVKKLLMPPLGLVSAFLPSSIFIFFKEPILNSFSEPSSFFNPSGIAPSNTRVSLA